MVENVPGSTGVPFVTLHSSPDVALENIPALSGVNWRWEELPGGLTNRNFKVDTSGQVYVLRLDSSHTADFDLDRDLESVVRENAFEAGLGAELIYTRNGVMLSKFLPGRAWQSADLEHDDNLVALARMLRRVHALPLTGTSFSAREIALRYAKAIDVESAWQPFAMSCLEILATIPRSDSLSCCHNDIVAGNVIEHAGLKLIDWEYACDNDPMFDLASLIGYHDLSATQADVLLKAYTGDANSEEYEQLQHQIRCFDIIQWLWFAARQSAVPEPNIESRLVELRSRIATY